MASESQNDQPDQERSDASTTPPPGTGRINSSRSGQAVSDNPVLRVDRDAGDVLAENVREEGRGDRSSKGEGSSNG